MSTVSSRAWAVHLRNLRDRWLPWLPLLFVLGLNVAAECAAWDLGRAGTFLQTLHDHARWRWGMEGLGVLLLGLVGWVMRRVIDERDLGLKRQQRLAAFNGMLAQVNQVMVSADDEAQFLQRLCDIARTQAGLALVYIARPGPDGRFAFVAAAGATGYLDGIVISADPGVAEGRGPGGIVWREGRPYFDAAFARSEALRPWRERAARFGLRASATLPIRRAGAMWAVLTVYHSEMETFDADLSQVLEELALNVSRGLDRLETRTRLAHLQREESRLARRDALTALPNRYALEEHLPRALARGRRDGKMVAVGMIDLDDFKPVNDTWGHDAGDRLLQELGRRLQARMREGDLLARLGGDEFALVIEDLDPAQHMAQLQQALARLHEAVEEPVDVGDGHRVTVGMSMGVALRPNRDGVEEGDLLLRRADAAMYRVKACKHARFNWWGLDEASMPTAAPAQDAQGVCGAQA